MSTILVTTLIAALASVIAAGLAFRSSSRANNTQDRKVGLEEHRETIERLKLIITEQDRQVDRLRTQLDRVQEQLSREQDISAAKIRDLQAQVDELSRSRARLETVLTALRTQPTEE